MKDGNIPGDFTVDRRRACRVAPASITYAQFGNTFAGIVVDISENGFALATSLSLISDPLTNIQVRINGVVRALTATGRAVWTDESTQRVGIEILAMTALDRLRFKQWIELQIFQASTRVDETSEAEDFVADVESVYGGAEEEHGPYPGVLGRQERSPGGGHGIVEDGGPATLQAVEKKTDKKHVVLGTASLILLAAGLALVLHNIPVREKFRERRPSADHAILEGKIHPSTSKGASPPDSTQGHSDRTQVGLAVDTAKNAEAESDPTNIWIDRKGGLTATLLKLPTRPLLHSGSLAVTSQRSMFIPRGDASDRRKQLLVVGRLILWTQPDFEFLENLGNSQPKVQLRATVGSKGEIVDVKPISGPARLFPAVLKAVREWRYEPTLLDGTPIDIQVDLILRFHPSGLTDQEI